jgi:hypothetical protein
VLTHTQVYHIDFCTPEFKYKVFTSIPLSSALYAVASTLIGRCPDADMAGVVADPTKLGYGKLYIMFLEYSKQQVARAFRIMGDPASYPLMIHCIHGCDLSRMLVLQTVLPTLLVHRVLVAWTVTPCPPLAGPCRAVQHCPLLCHRRCHRCAGVEHAVC